MVVVGALLVPRKVWSLVIIAVERYVTTTEGDNVQNCAR